MIILVDEMGVMSEEGDMACFKALFSIHLQFWN